MPIQKTLRQCKWLRWKLLIGLVVIGGHNRGHVLNPWRFDGFNFNLGPYRSYGLF